MLRVFDVGGQRSERKKWIHCFENVSRTKNETTQATPVTDHEFACTGPSARVRGGDMRV